MIEEDFRAAGKSLAGAVLRTIEGVPPDRLQTIQTPPDPGGES